MLRDDDDVLKHLDDYLHGALSPADVEFVERRCEESPVCKVALEQARRRLDALRAVPTVEAPEQLIQKSLHHVHVKRKRRETIVKFTNRAFWGTAAAAVLLIGVFHLHYHFLSASPYNLIVLGQTELLADSPASLRIRLVNAQTRAAVGDVAGEIMLVSADGSRSKKLAGFRTALDGSAGAQFTVPDWEDGNYQLRVTARPDDDEETITEQVTLKRSWRLMLSTDKPVYQPGQTIRVRSLALRRPDLKPVVGQSSEFSIRDPRGNVIFRQRGVSSKFGISATDCPLATEIIEGPYTVACRVGDTESESTVEVKKYVLPKFKIDVELDREYYAPGESVHGTVDAAYFFGKPVAGGQVEVVIQATDVAAQTLGTFKLETDERGRAEFDFPLSVSLIGREQDSGDARVAVYVTVTDTAGQTQSRLVSRVVTNSPIRIEVIPEAGTLARGVDNRVYVFTSYADGRPARVKLLVAGVGRELTTNELGIATLTVGDGFYDAEQHAGGANAFSVTFQATDDEDVSARRDVRLVYGIRGDDFVVRTDRSVYDGGGTMTLTALGGGVEPVFVDMIKDGQTMLTTTVDMAGGQGVRMVDLPAEMFGTVELVAYRFGPAGLPVRKSRALYIRQAGELKIHAEADHDQYRPGQQAKLTLSLTDNDGRPTPGAISLAAVDEAVFSVLSQAPGMEGRFFTLEQELLEPVYTIYASWQPCVMRAMPEPQRIEFEQALFARTWRRIADTAEFLSDMGAGFQFRVGETMPAVDDLMNWGKMVESSTGAQRKSPHSLSLASLPAKFGQVEAARLNGLSAVTTAWTVTGIVVALGAFVALVVTLYSVSRLVEIMIALSILSVLVMLLWPALQTARESARFAAVGLALEDSSVAENSAWDVGGDGATLEFEANLTIEDGPAPPRIRQSFPETLLWRPELITDEQGKVTIDIPLADSITSWRLSASAVSAAGQLGASQDSIRVFQPFFVDLNLPAALVRQDEVAVPVVVYNYLTEPQTVKVKLEDAEWFEALDATEQSIELAPGEVRSASFRVRAVKVGHHHLQVTATGGDLADAVRREIEVAPDGRRVDEVTSGTLQDPARIDIVVPAETIEGSVKAIVKIYPSSFSQLVEGLDNIFQKPYGCFEQTSSTTYPNVLALDYLKRTGKNLPEVEAKARQYIHLGYQRLLSFEIDGGGFDWFGNPPAHLTLSAYGLMEFEDMARVHDVDSRLIDRTRRWLLGQRHSGGYWQPSSNMLHEDPTRGERDGELARLTTTAYVAWAVYSGAGDESTAAGTRDWLVRHEPAQIDDPYVVALVAGALLAVDPEGRAAQPYCARLEALKKTTDDGKQCWWEQTSGRTTFYGDGRSGHIETTALATLALLEAGEYRGTTRGALSWLVGQKDAGGTWHSTQATVLALKALVRSAGASLGDGQDRRIAMTLDDVELPTVDIPADQDDVLRQIDLSDQLAAGQTTLTLTDVSDSAAGYQVAVRYHVPDESVAAEGEPLSVNVAYDRTRLGVDETVTATATVVNNLPAAAPMVILDLPIPAGFALSAEELDELVGSGLIAKYQITRRQAIIYLRQLAPAQPLVLQYRLRATMPVKITVPAAQAYHYYNPDVRASGETVEMVVGG